MKQINSLKVENLELKKMISRNNRDNTGSRRQRSSKKVAISNIDYDMDSVGTAKSKFSKRSTSAHKSILKKKERANTSLNKSRKMHLSSSTSHIIPIK